MFRIQVSSVLGMKNQRVIDKLVHLLSLPPTGKVAFKKQNIKKKSSSFFNYTSPVKAKQIKGNKFHVFSGSGRGSERKLVFLDRIHLFDCLQGDKPQVPTFLLLFPLQYKIGQIPHGYWEPKAGFVAYFLTVLQDIHQFPVTPSSFISSKSILIWGIWLNKWQKVTTISHWFCFSA